MLFDLDGVLVDTEGEYTRIWTGIEARFPTGIPDFAHYIKGSTLPTILEHHFAPADRAAVSRMLKEQEEAMHYPLFDGVRELLETLKANAIPCAIVTSSGDGKMERLFGALAGFCELFGAVVTDAMVAHSKPDPEGYLLAARLLGADIGRCLVVEDSFNGLAAGRAAGAVTVALATTNPAEVLAGKADVVLEDIRELGPLIRQGAVPAGR